MSYYIDMLFIKLFNTKKERLTSVLHMGIGEIGFINQLMQYQLKKVKFLNRFS